MPEFISLFKPSSTPLKLEFQTATDAFGLIKDAFRFETIMLFGAAAQIALILILPLRVAIVPAVVYAIYRLALTSLQASGVVPNEYDQGVIHSKYTAQFPYAADGRFGNTPAAQPVSVLLLGAKFNHPLGLLSPGAQEIGAHFESMNKDMISHADDFGLLGMSHWRACQQPDTNSMLIIYYFRDPEGINRFAHSEVHRKGWDWYNRAKHAHIGIMHEIFTVPAGAYESIYKNMAPMLMSASSVKVDNDHSGEAEWMRPIVSAEKGVLKTSFGRMGRSAGAEHEKYDFAKDGAV